MLYAVLLMALLVRAIAIFQFPANSNINSYIWEGQIQLSGYNPYLLAPDAEALKHLGNPLAGPVSDGSKHLRYHVDGK